MDSRQRGRFVRQSCWLLFACLTSASASFGQEGLSAGAPNIEILKLHWEKQVRLPRNFDPSVISTNGTFSDPISAATASANANNLDPKSAAATSRIRDSGNLNPVYPVTPARLPVFYVYFLKIENRGPKSIEGIAWDYVFIDSGVNIELGRHQFVSYAKVPTDKGATLQGRLRSPPIRVLRTSDSGKNAHPKFIEQAVIQCVLYADDTVWRNPSGRDGICEFLKNGKALLKRKRGAG